jgi:N-acetyl-anhydromuramyl-L-alanine amidase AmpD
MTDTTVARLERELRERRRQQASLHARSLEVLARMRKLEAAIKRHRAPHVVARPREAFRMSVANQSGRGGAAIMLIVLHDTEGANLPGIRDLRGLGAFFDTRGVDASAHVGNDAEGNAARFVEDGEKAWHCAAFNSVALGIEQIGFASQRSWPEAQLRCTAQYIAHWSQEHHIPIVHSIRHGVCRHSDLGAAGGGHSDPGTAYPLARVLQMARAMTLRGA